jgi:hypothetical protein
MAFLSNLEALRFLLDDSQKEEEVPPLRPDFDEQDFRRFVDRNHLSAAVFRAAQTRSGRWISAETKDYCKWHYLQQWRKNEVLLRDSAKLRDRLNAAGVAHCFLKGVFLAYRYFPDPDSRYSSDIDLMVCAADLEAAQRVLKSCGFERRSKKLLTDALTVKFTKNLEYTGTDSDLDLHWSIAEHLSYRFDPERMLGERSLLSIGRRTFDVPSDGDMLLTHILGAFGDIELGTNTLKPLWDMDRILGKIDGHTDWDLFFARRREEGFLAIAVNMLAMTLCLWNGQQRQPGVAGALARLAGQVRFDGIEECAELAVCARRLAARRWAWTLYESHVLKSLYWWTVSLPFRVAASRPPRRPSRGEEALASSHR